MIDLKYLQNQFEEASIRLRKKLLHELDRKRADRGKPRRKG